MFRALRRSSSGAPTAFAASGLHSVWWPPVVKSELEQFPLRLDYGRSPHAYVNQRLQIQLELPMMSGVPLETCWAFNERWNNKFCYKVASCWLFLLNHTTVHGSMNIKDKIMKGYFMLVNLYLVLLPSRPSSFVYIPVSLSELLKLLLLMISLYKTQR